MDHFSSWPRLPKVTPVRSKKLPVLLASPLHLPTWKLDATSRKWRLCQLDIPYSGIQSYLLRKCDWGIIYYNLEG